MYTPFQNIGLLIVFRSISDCLLNVRAPNFSGQAIKDAHEDMFYIFASLLHYQI